MVEAVRSRSEVIQGRINTLEQVVALAKIFPPLTSNNELAWVLKHGLAVEAYRRSDCGAFKIPGRDHGDADIMLISDNAEYRELVIWRGGGLDINPFGESGLLIRFGEALLNTVNEVAISDVNLICMHPALIVLHKIIDPRTLRHKDNLDLKILSFIMNKSKETQNEWDYVVHQGLRFLVEQYLKRKGQERWELFKQNPNLLI